MQEKIKILHITQGFGGLYTYIKQLTTGIDNDRFITCIIAPFNEECERFCIQYNIRYEILDMKRGFAPFSDVKALFMLRRKIKLISPNIVHVHSAKAGFLGRIASRWTGKRCIYTPHGLSYLSFTGFKRILFFSLETLCKRFTDKILACSESEKLRCIYELGLSSKKIEVLLNAVPISPFDTIYKDTTIHKTIHIGLVARLTYQKNPLLFIEIANIIHKKYPNVKFSILGAGFHDHLKNEVEDLISSYELNDNITLFKWGAFKSIDEYLNTLDIFLMPSIFEGLPFSLLEAMKTGVVCVTSKCDGCNDVIDNEINGFSCMQLDDYVKIISKYIETPDKFDYIRTNAYDILKQKFNLNSFIKEMEIYYTSFVD